MELLKEQDLVPYSPQHALDDKGPLFAVRGSQAPWKAFSPKKWPVTGEGAS